MSAMQVSIKINPELLEEFRKVSIKMCELKYSDFIVGFLYYAGFPDLRKIFEYRFQIIYADYDVYDEKNQKITTSFKIRIPDYNKIEDIVKSKDLILSIYIREFITFVVSYKKEFFEIFNFQYINFYEENYYNDFLNITPQVIQTVAEYTHFLASDLKVLDKKIIDLQPILANEQMKMVYSDFEYENILANTNSSKYFSDLSDVEQLQILLSKQDFKQQFYQKIKLLHIVTMKLIFIYIYKTIISNQKRILDRYTDLKKQIEHEYHVHEKKEDDKISFSEFILAVIYDDNELLKFAHTGRIKLLKNTHKKMQFFGKKQILLRGQ